MLRFRNKTDNDFEKKLKNTCLHLMDNFNGLKDDEKLLLLYGLTSAIKENNHVKLDALNQIKHLIDTNQCKNCGDTFDGNNSR